MTIKKLEIYNGMSLGEMVQREKINEIIKEFEEEKKVSDNRFNNLIKEIREIKDWINAHGTTIGKSLAGHEMQGSGSTLAPIGVGQEPRPDIELKYNELADECGTCDTCLKINERITRNKTLDEIEERLLSDETEGMSIKSIIAEMRGKK